MTKHQVDMFTTEQYSTLADMISDGRSPMKVSEAIYWLWKGTWRRADYRFVKRPLDDMPLCLNDECDKYRTIARWRLRIGR